MTEFVGEPQRVRIAARMSTIRRLTALLVTMAALLPGILAGSAAADDPPVSPGSDPAAAGVGRTDVSSAAAPGGLEPVTCDVLQADGLLAASGADRECGYLAVPERRASPGSRMIKLAVVVLRATGPVHQPDPLVMAQGGPGGPTIEAYVTSPAILGPLAAGHDVVLFDQRGVGKSLPALNCTEQTDLTLRTAEQLLSPEEEERLSLDAATACRARLVADGVDLAGYTTVENAADVEALRVALGYQKIDLYGVSYGTALALEVLRRYPASLRSVILDGVVPPQIAFNETAGKTLDAAMTAFFGACAADPHCAQAFPDLEATFNAQLARLDREPVRVPMTDPETGTVYQVPIDGRGLQGLLFQLLYVSPVLGALPQLIHDVRDNRFDSLGQLAGLFVFDRSIAYGMYNSVICAEDADIDPVAAGGSGLRPAVARLGTDGARLIVATCRRWAVPSLSPGIDAPVAGDVPTLLLSGRFDPITPASFAAQAAASLTRARSYTFPTTGHGAFGAEPCASEIVESFLADPSAQPRDGCLAQLTGPQFVTPGEVVRVPAVLRLASPTGAGIVELSVFGAALLVLLSGWLVLPLAWLIRRLSRLGRPVVPSRLARWVPWLVALDAAALVVFAGALLVAVGTAEQAVTVLGVSSDYRWIFLLSTAAALLAVVIAVGVVMGWRAGGWRLWRRIYLSLLAVAGLTCAALLVTWGTVGPVLLG